MGWWQAWGSPAIDSRTRETLHLAGPSLCSLELGEGRQLLQGLALITAGEKRTSKYICG